jgi:hypothetical protein
MITGFLDRRLTPAGCKWPGCFFDEGESGLHDRSTRRVAVPLWSLRVFVVPKPG